MHTSIDFNEKKGFICDMDGVIYHGNRILPGVAEFIQWLHEEDKEYLFLTNNSGYTPRELNQKLARMGLDVPEEHFYTSALATAAFCDGDYSLLSVATKDALHQKYRLPLIDGGEEMEELAQDLGALAVYISGAGPTIMAVVHRDDEEFFARAKESLPQSEKLKHFTVHRLLPDNVGATVK